MVRLRRSSSDVIGDGQRLTSDWVQLDLAKARRGSQKTIRVRICQSYHLAALFQSSIRARGVHSGRPYLFGTTILQASSKLQLQPNCKNRTFGQHIFGGSPTSRVSDQYICESPTPTKHRPRPGFLFVLPPTPLAFVIGIQRWHHH